MFSPLGDNTPACADGFAAVAFAGYDGFSNEDNTATGTVLNSSSATAGSSSDANADTTVVAGPGDHFTFP